MLTFSDEQYALSRFVRHGGASLLDDLRLGRRTWHSDLSQHDLSILLSDELSFSLSLNLVVQSLLCGTLSLPLMFRSFASTRSCFATFLQLELLCSVLLDLALALTLLSRGLIFDEG